MNDIVFHVGLHKTATTWLQYEVFSKLRGVSYLHAFELDTVLPDGKVVVSCEWLSGRPHLLASVNERYVIAERISTLYPDAKIILGVREKDSWMRSLWKQYVMEGGSLSYLEFIRRLDDGYLDFEGYIRALQSLFDDVFIYHLDEIKDDKQSVIDNLCSFMDVELPIWRDRIYRKSLSDNKITTLRYLNRVVHPRFKPIFSKIVKDITGSWRGEYNV